MGSIRKKISTRFKNRYRLIIRKDEDLEEKVSIVLTPLNSLLVLSALIVMFGTLIILMLAYTPMSNILPVSAVGFSNQDRLELLQKIDSLSSMARQRNFQEQMLREILQGNDSAYFPEMSKTTPKSYEQINPTVSGISGELKFKTPVDYTFYTPLKGTITDTFNIDRNHFAVDIGGKRQDVIKAAQKGTVIFSAWNPETGHTMILQHANDFITVYKHNSVLLKKEGNFVNAGDAIALVGNSGEYSSGPHLHFELWNRGIAIDPQKYVSF